ncbi:MAG TPA: hypothetical protein PK467_02505 [Candidatus Wallbacteria bacterium]|nr:hypothetical protein [Candidatus Wallbacteria bacterium]
MKNIFALATLSLILLAAVFNFAAHSKDNPANVSEKHLLIDVNNSKCPVMGGDAQKGIYCINEGKIYHFCCPACVPEFEKNPARYIAKIKPSAEKDQVKIEIAGNKLCPVTGEAADKKITAIKGGKLYYLCCESCIPKFMKDNSDTDARKHDHGKK